MGNYCGKGAASAVETPPGDAPTTRPPAITTGSKPAAEEPTELRSPASTAGKDEEAEAKGAPEKPPSPLENAAKPMPVEEPILEAASQAAAEAPVGDAKGAEGEDSAEAKGGEAASPEKPTLVEVELTDDMRDKAIRSFERSDANKDGKVTIDELKNLLDAAGKNASAEDVTAFVSYFDLKKKSYLDLDDFLEIMKHKVSDQPAGQASEPPASHSRMTSFLSFLLSTPVPSKEEKPEDLDDVAENLDEEEPKVDDDEDAVAADPDKPPGPVRRTGSLTPSFLLQMKPPSTETSDTTPKAGESAEGTKTDAKDEGDAAPETEAPAESDAAPALGHTPKRKSFVEILLSPFSGEAREEEQDTAPEPASEPAAEPATTAAGVTQ